MTGTITEYDWKKIEAYWQTHEVITEWDEPLIAPPSLRGAWIEAQYRIHEGLCYDITRLKEKVSGNDLRELILSLGGCLDLLSYDKGWAAPYIVEIDSEGYCHLLTWLAVTDEGENEEMQTGDEIIWKGTREIIKI